MPFVQIKNAHGSDKEDSMSGYRILNVWIKNTLRPDQILPDKKCSTSGSKITIFIRIKNALRPDKKCSMSG